MSIIELIASFSPLRFVTDWRHENTEREKNRLQMMLEKAKIESAERQSFHQIESERQKEQHETIRVLAKEHLIRVRAVKDILALVADNDDTRNSS